MLAVCLMAVGPSFCALSFSLPSQNAELVLDIMFTLFTLAGYKGWFCCVPLSLSSFCGTQKSPSTKAWSIIVYLLSVTQDWGVCNQGLSGFKAEFQVWHGQAPLCVDRRNPSFVQMQIWSEVPLQPDPTTSLGA